MMERRPLDVGLRPRSQESARSQPKTSCKTGALIRQSLFLNMLPQRPPILRAIRFLLCLLNLDCSFGASYDSLIGQQTQRSIETLRCEPEIVGQAFQAPVQSNRLRTGSCVHGDILQYSLPCRSKASKFQIRPKDMTASCLQLHKFRGPVRPIAKDITKTHRRKGPNARSGLRNSVTAIALGEQSSFCNALSSASCIQRYLLALIRHNAKLYSPKQHHIYRLDRISLSAQELTSTKFARTRRR